jgi:catechol 2,3-dioxygenase-like lactoylglutathione lyase family enzyme
MISHMSMYASIPVKDIQAAKHFYGEVLGLNIVDENLNGSWYESGNTRIAVYESKYGGTNKGTAAIFEVIDPEAIVEMLQGKGVPFEKYNMPGVKREGFIHTIGDFRGAWFKDPSGNIIAMGTHL